MTFNKETFDRVTAELQHRIDSGDALIAQYKAAIDSPEGLKYPRSLAANLKSMERMRERLLSEIAAHKIEGWAEGAK